MPRKKKNAAATSSGNEKDAKASSKPERQRRGRRSYGGKEGVWLKKNRLGSSNCSSTSANDSDRGLKASVGIQPSPALSVDENDPSPERRTSTLRVVGWDDVLSRPIYESSKVSDISDLPTAISNSSPEDRAQFTSSSSISNAKRDVLRRGVQTGVKRLTRSYGGTRKKRSLSSAATAVLEDCGESPVYFGKKRRKRVEHTPVRRREEKCNNTPSSGEATAATAALSPSPSSGNASIFSDGAVHSAGKDVVLSGGGPAEKLSFSPSNFSFRNEVVTKENPNSSTSPAVAKAYFDQLDSSHELSVQEGESQEGRCDPVRRTSRKATEFKNNPKLVEEYEAYRTSTEEGGITPITMEEFASNRNKYFRRSDRSKMLDDVLDDTIETQDS